MIQIFCVVSWWWQLHLWVDMWIGNTFSQCHTHELKEQSLSTGFYVTCLCLWPVCCRFHCFSRCFLGCFCLGCPCWQLPMPTRRPDHTRLQSSVCMGGFRVYTISNGVLDVLFHVSNHTFQQSQSLFYVCGSMPFPFSISIACQVKASQEDRNKFFKSTTSQQSPMTMMQHWNKGPPTGTHLHIPLTPKVL